MKLWSRLVFTGWLALFMGCSSAEEKELSSIVDQINSVTFYQLKGLSGLEYSKRELERAYRRSLDPKPFQKLVHKAKHKDGLVIWKGSRLVIVEFKNGTEKRLAVSSYGGFFKVLGEEGYFVFDGEAREQWEEYVWSRQ